MRWLLLTKKDLKRVRELLKKDGLDIFSRNCDTEIDIIEEIRLYYTNNVDDFPKKELEKKLIILKNSELEIVESKSLEYFILIITIFLSYVGTLVTLASGTDKVITTIDFSDGLKLISNLNSSTNKNSVIFMIFISLLIIITALGFNLYESSRKKCIIDKKISINMHKSVIAEILKEMDEKEKVKREKKLIEELREIQTILKENKKETSIVEKIINKFKVGK